MKAVWKRELNAYFNNVYGCLFISVVTLFAGVVALLVNLLNGSPETEYVLLNGEYALIVMVPLLCMRSMAEDRRNHTDRFYLSLPLSTTAVVLGKFFALVTVFAIPCAFLALFPLIFSIYGHVNLLGAYVSLALFFLLGVAAIAVCQFISSLTDNLIIAAVLGVAVLAFLLVMPLIMSLIPPIPLVSFLCFVGVGLIGIVIAWFVTRSPLATLITAVILIVPVSVLYIFFHDVFGGLFQTVISLLSPFLQFEYVASSSILDLSSLTMLLSYPVFFVFLTVRSADKKRFA